MRADQRQETTEDMTKRARAGAPGARHTPYQSLIEELEPGLNPVGAESLLRLDHPTLDHLSRAELASELRTARLAEQTQPGLLRQCADSSGLIAAHDSWDRENRESA